MSQVFTFRFWSEDHEDESMAVELTTANAGVSSPLPITLTNEEETRMAVQLAKQEVARRAMKDESYEMYPTKTCLVAPSGARVRVVITPQQMTVYEARVTS